MHEVGLIGGTFDRFHDGHVRLLESSLEACTSVEVWLTSDSSAHSKDPRILAWEERCQEIRDRMGPESAERISFGILEDSFGPAPTHPNASAITCTLETRSACAEINSIRLHNHLLPLEIIEVEHLMAWDGAPISSSRIRNGEIDRTGLPWIPSSVREGRVNLTPEVEAELKDPFGQLVQGPEDDPSVAMSKVIAHIGTESAPVIAVGDVTVLSLQVLGRPADIALVDGCTRRRTWEGAEGIDSSAYGGVLQCESPAGSLTPSLLEACEQAMVSWMEDGTTHLLEVKGEEDLATLLMHPLAPLGSVVLYGQPGSGVVIRWCSEESKQRCRKLLGGFERAE
ncbi:MAG: pantetheine-phosphate adenylyltransferase [Candidatus Thalassarchaeaceae archaeon]|nr:pantetheine-phosphate adenylyltransferase [Candidatus Thalassarchaeaceae archaeon]MDP6703389.1 pantetheine-phosphate adenylyltransferase [Candidatus Thalassarchaeaceae archaeon]MDP7003441.1 pantetheine-phosphate adenylyltransferase [Candidatus Thalassarchaeaceae archaeon]